MKNILLEHVDFITRIQSKLLTCIVNKKAYIYNPKMEI